MSGFGSLSKRVDTLHEQQRRAALFRLAADLGNQVGVSPETLLEDAQRIANLEAQIGRPAMLNQLAQERGGTVEQLLADAYESRPA